VSAAAQPDLLNLQDNADPRVATAVVDFRARVIEVRDLSAQLFALPVADPKRPALQEAIDDRVGGMQARADTVGITLDELFRLINLDLAGRRTGNTQAPHGDHLRALCDENTAAHADERTIHRELERLKSLLPGAVDRRMAADRACAGFVAGWAIRGTAR